MSVQDDKSADQDADLKSADEDTDQKLTEKPEPDEDDKAKAAEMMEAYKEKPTIVLPGTGGSVSGTAVNDWLDEDGNPKHEVPEGTDSKAENSDDERDEQALKEQIEKDKELNEKLKEAAAAENKGEKG
ncbi:MULTISPECIES: hypothetical protein [unclassified Mycobacterium]|uniref:hypothetical protein n=1 Tax=unclassified Mycobacterium TaxID=2642494 RepID=UPI0007FB73E2|nr:MULTISPECIES: hypothetical protein [unclassified Mycobacterium]OBG55338.1 hypothetical protein A5704_25585 [Mycobacterium sp. E735]OBG66915.1 hypothetical protein A5703_13040 [Mycobacterium sp. E188]OBG76609.1 hypothetical protein A9X05_24340 [Mycobacterium sp. E3298]OBG80332.1 hypothetical protein A5701_11860 [Mycobacterium sp. E3305]OBH17916.1 hypothetical protein A9X03_02380 [Mycobacterium sp. E1715]